MQNSDVVTLRHEYDVLIRIADGLVDMIRQKAACNIATFLRMAEEARAAAHKIASAIEKLVLEVHPEPPKRHGVWAKIVDVFSAVAKALACA